MRCFSRFIICWGLILSTACASVPYRYGTGRIEEDVRRSPRMEQQIYVGRPNRFLDASDWFTPNSLLGKLLLWDKDVDSHQISSETIALLQTYMKRNDLRNVLVLVNQYSPGNQWKRLFRNGTIGRGWRYTFGLLSVTLYTILPGRFFGGDAYNPYTNTIYLYSDDPSIALHEAGHAKDFGRRKYKGTYAFLGALPFVGLYHEAKATSDTLGYLEEGQKLEAQKEAYEILYPAYSTHVFGEIRQFYPNPLLLLGVITGHIVGQAASANVKTE